MKIQISRKLMVALIALPLIASCADGELAVGGPGLGNITPAAPIIIAFNSSNGDKTVKSGDSVTISWEVSGADSVQIVASSAGAAVPFNVNTQDLKSSAPTPPLTADTDFTITATKKAVVEDSGAKPKSLVVHSSTFRMKADAAGDTKKPATGDQSVSQKLTVKVGGGMKITASANPDTVSADGQSILKWSVEPSDGVAVTITASDGQQIVAFTECGGDINTILQGTKADPIPAAGCAVVQASTTTTFTIEATDSSGNKESAEVTLTVSNVAGQLATITVNGSHSLLVDSFDNALDISWSAAAPSGSTVSVTAAPEADCTPSLDKATAKGSAKCNVKEATTFTISVKDSAGKVIFKDDAGVALKGGGGSAVQLAVPHGWAFSGEEVFFTIGITDQTKANAASIEQVAVNGVVLSSDELKSLKSTGSTKVKSIAGDTGITVMLRTNGADITYKPFDAVRIQHRSFTSSANSVAIKAATGAVFDSGLNLYAGMMAEGFNKGVGLMYSEDNAMDGTFSQFDFFSAFKAEYPTLKWNAEYFDNYIKTFPVVTAVREMKDKKEIFAGTSGAVMRTEDRGSTWKYIMVLPYFEAAGKDGTHTTCGYDSATKKQKIQTGSISRTYGDLVSLTQVCDILVPSGDRTVVVATDFGVFVNKNVDDAKIVWLGQDSNNATLNHVVNALEIADSKIYAGTDVGIFVSSDGGVKWDQSGTLKESVYSLAYDSTNKKLYVGTATGLQVMDGSGALQAVALTEPTAILSIAIDSSSSPAMLLGTTGGMFVSRDAGKSFNSVTLPGSAGKGAEVHLVAIASRTAADGVSYRVAIGSSSNLYGGGATIQSGMVHSEGTPDPAPTPDKPPIISSALDRAGDVDIGRDVP